MFIYKRFIFAILIDNRKHFSLATKRIDQSFFFLHAGKKRKKEVVMKTSEQNRNEIKNKRVIHMTDQRCIFMENKAHVEVR